MKKQVKRNTEKKHKHKFVHKKEQKGALSSMFWQHVATEPNGAIVVRVPGLDEQKHMHELLRKSGVRVLRDKQTEDAKVRTLKQQTAWADRLDNLVRSDSTYVLANKRVGTHVAIDYSKDTKDSKASKASKAKAIPVEATGATI